MKTVTLKINHLGDMKNLNRSEKNKGIKDRVLRDIRTLFESDKEDYYKPIRNGNAFSSNYIEYESNRNNDKILLIDDYLDKIEPYLNDLIDNHRTQGEWKIQLTMAITFISSKYFEETRNMPTKSDNIEHMMGNETNEIIEELFNSLLQRYQKGLEEKMRGSNFFMIVLIYCITNFIE